MSSVPFLKSIVFALKRSATYTDVALESKVVCNELILFMVIF